MGLRSWINPIMVMVECSAAGSSTLSKMAMTEGMSDFVFVAYSSALAFLFLLPSTLIYHRNRACPKICFAVVCRIFVLGIVSCSCQIFLYKGIGYSSPALASAMKCLGPAFTIILAIVFRMEKVDWKLRSSQTKLIGTLISIAGAYIVIFYQGPPIIFQSQSTLNLLRVSNYQSNWIIGGCLLATATLFLSLEFIVRTWIIKAYPAEMVVTLVNNIFTTILLAVVAFIVEGASSAWKLTLGMELVAIAYNAIFMAMFRAIVYAWACRVKGPVFVAMFKPLGIPFAVFMGAIFLGDVLYIGNVIGTATIALGLYTVSRGKAEEVEMPEDNSIVSSSASPSDNEVPLLQSITISPLR